MDIIMTHDKAVCTEVPIKTRKPNYENDLMERLKKSASTSMEKKKSESKKLKKKLIQIEEQNESLSKMIYEKNTEIVELRKSVNSLNEVLNSVPLDELRCNSSIASSKLLELNKKNRQLRAELETTKNHLNRKDVQIQRLEKNLKLAEEKHQHDKECSKKGSTPLDELQAKLSSMQQKLFETRNKNVELSNQLKLAQKCLQQEIGEHYNLNTLAAHATNSNWRGRAQQILHLQQKVQELKQRLEQQEEENYDCHPPGDVSEQFLTSISGSILSMDRPNVRKTELQHRAKVENLEKEIAALKSQLDEAQNKILALKVRNKTLNDEISKHKMKTNNLEEQSDFNSINLATMNDKLNQQKLQYEKKIADMADNSKKLANENDDLKLNNDHLQTKMEELEQLIVNKEDQIMQLQEVIKKLEADLKAICGGFLFSCRELRKEEFITILDTLEAEKNSLMEHNKRLNERVEGERLKNEHLHDQNAKQKIRISRLESKIREMEREIDTNNEKKKRSQRIAEYASSLSAMGSNTSLMSFTFENSSILNAPNCNNSDNGGGDMGEVANVTELRNRLELASEKITILREKLDHISAEKDNDLKTFEHIINNTKNIIIETLLAQRASLSSLDIK
ncbi:putative leucine-rich repeat-containing protein DDB_G0290503 [Musca vetustissima]|uniref:putative leucine-rich repeat-containing protein DDB_G0290503 n=1 Tax=Musca vetustissima TaxID=27455 RepID=UPI002AB5E419|nr:putative leucine-rich repeat-containing protein DDB_G0290503 [Musca vetustissima]